MVTTLGNAIAGNAYGNRHYPLPQFDTALVRAPHKPWCADCKRTDRGALDGDGVCERCAKARVTRAEQRARWAEAEKAELAEQRAASTKRTPAAKKAAPKPKAKPAPRPKAVRPKLSAPATQGKPGRKPLPLPVTDIVEAYLSGTSTNELAERHHVSSNTISRLLKRHEVKVRIRKVARTPELDEQLRSGYVDQHLTMKELGRRTGMSHVTVGKILTELGVEIRTSRAHKIPDTAHPAIIARYQAGETAKEIGATYDSTGDSILYILRKRGVEIRPRGRRAS